LPFSTSTTETPNDAAAAATVSPPEPAPITQMSGVNNLVMKQRLQEGNFAGIQGTKTASAVKPRPVDSAGVVYARSRYFAAA
jgi:hypothetical protein